MCLVTSPKRDYYVKERDYYAPRPVSNFHGGPRSSITTGRRYSSSVPVERVSYRSSVRSVPRSSGEVYRKTSRTYVR